MLRLVHGDEKRSAGRITRTTHIEDQVEAIREAYHHGITPPQKLTLCTLWELHTAHQPPCVCYASILNCVPKGDRARPTGHEPIEGNYFVHTVNRIE
jgi:hypothetical protein